MFIGVQLTIVKQNSDWCILCLHDLHVLKTFLKNMEPQSTVEHFPCWCSVRPVHRQISQGISYVTSDQMKMAQILRTVKIHSKTPNRCISAKRAECRLWMPLLLIFIPFSLCCWISAAGLNRLKRLAILIVHNCVWIEYLRSHGRRDINWRILCYWNLKAFKICKTSPLRHKRMSIGSSSEQMEAMKHCQNQVVHKNFVSSKDGNQLLACRKHSNLNRHTVTQLR